MHSTLTHAALFASLVATAAYLAFLVRQRPLFASAGTFALLGAALLQTGALGIRWLQLGIAPVTNTPEALAFSALLIAVIYLGIQRYYKLPVVGAFVTPLASVAWIGAMSASDVAVPANLRSSWLLVHISAAFLGEAVLALAFVTATVFLVLDAQLKQKRPFALTARLPSLDLLDGLTDRFLLVGLPLLTLAIITGALWLKQQNGQFFSAEPRQGLAIINWVIYAAIVHMRLTLGYRGRRLAYATVLGFAALVASFLLYARHGA